MGEVCGRRGRRRFWKGADWDMARKKGKSGGTGAKQEAGRPARRFRFGYVLGIVVLVGVSNVVTYVAVSGRPARPVQYSTPLSTIDPTAPLRDFQVVNAHDHLFSEKYLAKYFDAAEKTGIVRTLFVASSEYTLKGAPFSPEKGNDANSAMLIRVGKKYPGKIIPFCTIHPGDPDKLEKVKRYVAEGAQGLKLYSGHGNFYDRPLDVEDMLPVYAYCDATGLPICWHVNMLKYQDEFIRVMDRFPNMTVIVPHFGVTFYVARAQPFRDFQMLLDRYPNMYTDTSFGTRQILVAGLEAVSRDTEIFRAFFDKYSDRVFYGTDMVVTGNKEKTPEWVEAVLRACRDVLEKDIYYFFMGARGSPYAYPRANNVYGAYRGLALDDATLKKVYETNIEKLFPRP